MIADPLWSCVMLLCGRLWSFAVFSHSLKTLKLEQPNVAQPLHNRLHACIPSSVFTNLHWGPGHPPAKRGPSLECIYWVSLTVDLCEGNKISK